MTFSVYVPLVICVGLGFVAPWLSTRLPPASGTWVVATDTMLRALNPAQRRVLMAHERAHLDAAHGVALSWGRLGAAANPLLRPAARAVSFLSERHADERAATAVGDREPGIADRV